MIIDANDPALKSWVEVPEGSDFPIQNLPFGIFRSAHKAPRAGIAIGEQVLDLFELYKDGFLKDLPYAESAFNNLYLNELIGYGKKNARALRSRISHLLKKETNDLRNHKEVSPRFMQPVNDVELLLPVLPGDYTDFYSSISHATNVGKMFRPDNPLLPNWKHLPVGYHGRCSSIIVSGKNFIRPKGQMQSPDGEFPVFGSTKQLDFELEMAFITCSGKEMGESISTAEADEYIFGMVIFNDWSARDIQRWEYAPLGPFLAKNFASSVSPWIVTLDALEPFRVKGEIQFPEVLPYLRFEGEKNIDIQLEVFIEPENSEPVMVSRSNYANLYWNMTQQLAHHTVNGCNIKAGDMYASGTISGDIPESFGSMLELTWRGTNPIRMRDNTERKFINDHDTVIMKAWCKKNNLRIGFGEVRSKVYPAKE